MAPPQVKALNRSVAAKQVTELVGFWVAWHLYGGFEGLVDQVGMHPSTVWRKVKKFRLAFKEHPDMFKMPVSRSTTSLLSTLTHRNSASVLI